MSERHELFDELEAFDPKFQENYRTLWLAVHAASKDTPYVRDLYDDYARQFSRAAIENVPDILSAIESARKAEEDSPEFQSAFRKLNSQADAGRY
jgi:hypothetical protein